MEESLMPRPKRNTRQVNIRLDIDLMDKLISTNPFLSTIDTRTGEPKFRHGALSRYVSALIADDLRKDRGLRSELGTLGHES